MGLPNASVVEKPYFGLIHSIAMCAVTIYSPVTGLHLRLLLQMRSHLRVPH